MNAMDRCIKPNRPQMTRHCDECAHGNSDRPAALVCDKGHKPKWHMPKSGIDTGWGYKRKCAEFRAKTCNAKITGGDSRPVD